MELKKTVCYEDFGAVGDGVTDDYDAIAKAHAYANENGLDVVTDSSKTYYIGDTGIDEKTAKPTIIIKTNVDWGKSNFIIDDTSFPSSSPAKSSLIFKVLRENPMVVYTPENDTPNGAIARINAEGGFKRDVKKLDFGLGYAAMIFVRNDEKTVYVRFGLNQNSGEPQNELVCLDKDGNVDPNTPFLLDYDKITKLTVIRIDDAPLTIKGGIFTTIPKDEFCQSYYNRGISIARSNVTVDGITYKIAKEGENGNPYTAFLDVILCANVTIQNSTFQAHKFYMKKTASGAMVGMGTYGISAHDSNNVVWKNCIQSNFYADDGVTRRRGVWDIMGSSGCKNLAYIDSTLARLDAHAGMYNAKIINSKVWTIALSGGGTLEVINSHVYCGSLIEMRSDYGSSWDGKIIVKDVTMHCDTSPTLFHCGWYNHNFGLETHIPEEIIIDGLKLTTPNDVNIFPAKYIEQISFAHLDEIDGKPNVNKTTPPKRIVIKNNKNGYKFKMPDTEFFRNTELIIED